MKKPTSLLLVEDEDDVSLTAKTTLEKCGLAVECYKDPTIALSKFKPDLYDLSFLDNKMPKMDGFELYQKLKEMDEKAKI
jgi:CheY-like chemotaxis protein